MKKVIYTDKAPKPIGPYSQAILIDKTLYLSGQIAYKESIQGDLQVETHQVMKQLGAVLEAAGMNYSHVVKCSIFLKDMDSFTLVNEVYGEYFDKEPPARETVEVAKLPKNVNVEISAVAIKP